MVAKVQLFQFMHVTMVTGTTHLTWSGVVSGWLLVGSFKQREFFGLG